MPKKTDQRPVNQEIDRAYEEYSSKYFERKPKDEFTTLLAVIIGSLLMGFNQKVLLNAGNLVPSGVNGVAILFQRIMLKFAGVSIPFTPISLLLNLGPIYMGFKAVGKKFTLYSILSIVILSFTTDLIPSFFVTDDLLLIAIFGGLIQGTANAIPLKYGASTGGTMFIAMYFSVKHNINTFNYIFAANATVILLSGLLFGMDSALYTIIFQFVSTQVLNFAYNKYAKKTLFIITDQPDEVSTAIMVRTHHACTVFSGKGTYTGEPRHMVYTVAGADNVPLIFNSVHEIDKNAFINVVNTDKIDGRFFSRDFA
ncbi:MAG: YitT family protein [Firmicutes bacterium]|nr:YitT family protein [Bacillota bacterium]